MSDQPATLPVDEQRTTTVSNRQPSTSAQEDDHSQSSQNLSSAATISQQAIPSTSKSKKSTCLFCDHVEKKVGKKRIYVTFPQSEATVETIKSMAEKSNDSKLLAKLENPRSVAYHSTCLSSYQMSLRRQSQEHPEPRYWHKNRQFHQLAFNAISEIIKADIIGRHRVMFLTDLFIQYKSLLLEFAEGQVRAEDIKEYRAETLENKIMKAFGDQITIESMGTPKKKIVYQYDMDTSRLVGEIAKLESIEKNRCRDVAYELRNCITSLESTKLRDKLTPDDVILGECNIPELLFNFVCDLVQGPDTRRQNSSDDLMKIKSVCSDLIYIISKGRVKPSKHLTLGLAMKSMTSSRKVLTILNRYGHTIGYNLAEEIETEMTYSSVQENNVVPAGISRVDGLSTHVAFDNFDRFVDTATGKDTLHDTVGIIYQFSSENDNHNNINDSNTSDSESVGTYVDEGPTEPLARARKRRRFEATPKEIRPFVKVPLTSMTFLPFQTITETIDACHLEKSIAIDKDLIWSMSLSQIDSVPMWLGYNCKISIDESKIQTVEYLSPINESPTSLAIVNETLNIAKEVAKTCNQQQIIVTYDLAIAKLAMQIQHTKKPEFDNLFINLGAFHTQMAFFKAIGKYIDSSGLIEILVEAEALAGGSMNSFLDSKHFNRCKRLHPLAFGALQILHFEKYLSEIDTNDIETLKEDLNAVMNTSCETNESIVLPDSLHQILQGYKQFREITLQGGHGKTAQYYLQYTELINIFLRFSRSIRCSNLELYLASIFEMCGYFFVFNQPNYAKWTAMYLNNLIKLKVDNSILLEEFRKGAFGIRRTKSCLGRSPVDLTLEQTINADAGNTLTGVSHFTNSIAARERWALSHSVRTKIMSFVKAEIGLSQADDTSYTLQKNRIEKDSKTLNSIVETIKKTMNPFSGNVDKDSLFNLSTGKAASLNVTDYLLNVKSLGKEQKLKFISECFENSTRFVRPIPRNKMYNFASDCVKKSFKSTIGDQKTLIKMERDIFGRLLAIAINQKVDIGYCLSFPLAPVPPALFHCSGDMMKTDKSTLGKQLTAKIAPANPGQVDIEVIDGFYYLYQIGASLPQTFGKVAESILIKLCSRNAPEVHIIFDRYLTPSIKDSERQNREGVDIPYTINGPLQTRPNDFLKSLKNFRFKEALVKFLANHWIDDSFATVLGNKKNYITVGEQCFSYCSAANCVVQTEETELACQHEEADTRIVFHISKLPINSKILVNAADTDVLIILLGNMQKFSNLQIWLANSTSKKINNKDEVYINCTDLSITLGATLCLALPAFHAYTGCDYTAAFFNKGKIRPFKIFMKHPQIQKVFASLTNPNDIFEETKIDAVQEFTCLMYGLPKCQSINAARFLLFNKMYASKQKNEKFMKRIKGFDSTHIPPCWKSLKQKLLRTIFVNSMWLNATEPNCIKFSAENNGWLVLDGFLKPTWFLGDSTPTQVASVLCDSANKSSNNDDGSNICSDESDNSDDSLNESSDDSDF